MLIFKYMEYIYVMTGFSLSWSGAKGTLIMAWDSFGMIWDSNGTVRDWNGCGKYWHGPLRLWHGMSAE